MIACLLTGADWWLNTIPIVLVTLACRWIAVGIWHEIEDERQREQRRQWQQQLHDHERNKRS